MPKIYEYTEVSTVDGSEHIILSKNQITYKATIQRFFDALGVIGASQQDINDAITAHESTYDHSILSDFSLNEIINFTYYGIPDKNESIFYAVISKPLRLMWNSVDSKTYIREVNDTPTSTPVSFSVLRNGSTVAALSYSSGNSLSFAGNATGIGYIDLLAGDRFEIIAPPNINAQIFEDISFSFYCELV